MSYQVLARKWRPQTFQEVIGQPHVLTALENGLNQDRVHHAYLFSGTRGVGKTTIARLLAKSLNCEEGVTSTPCGKCRNCQDIDQGRFVDLLEIDAASRTKVDDTRELLDNVQYKPAQGRYKVYLIDEVHMLSKHSFNALLKTLEEPPEYVKFLLATTDPQKLPITVLSRCLQFHLKAILPEQIEQQLSDILKQEQATFDMTAIKVIAKAADGSMRDALSLTDQALAFGAGHIEYNAVLKMLGTIDQSHLHYLLHFIASGNSVKVFEKIQEFVYLGADFAALHQELANLCHQIALTQLQPNTNVTDKTTIQLLAERLTPEEVQLFYQIALEGFKDYRYAPSGKVALEMTVMRLLAFKPADYVDIDEAMLAESAKVERVSPPEKKSATVESLPPSKPPTENETPQVVPESQLSDELNINNDATKVSVEQVDNLPELPQSTTVSAPQAETPVTTKTIENDGSVTSTTSSTMEDSSMLGDEASSVKIETRPVEHKITATQTNSRNMLRSHRLKREALKKNDATTDKKLPAGEQSVAEPIKTVEKKPESPLSNELPNNVIHKDLEEVKTAPTSVAHNEELPPLSSYDAPAYSPEYADSELDTPPGNYFNPAENQGYVESDNRFKNTALEEAELESHNVERASLDRVVPQNSPVIESDSAHSSNSSELAEHEVNTAEIIPHHDISAITSLSDSSVQVTFADGNVVDNHIDIATYVDDKVTNSWFLTIKSMQLAGLEKLLAKNTVMQKNTDSILLTVHESQQHLLNNHALCESLKNKLGEYFGKEYSVVIKPGKVEGKHTPMELESIVYQEYLDKAKLSIKNDPIVQTFVQDYNAKVYENSVVPL